jgi:hypothetical protein
MFVTPGSHLLQSIILLAKCPRVAAENKKYCLPNVEILYFTCGFTTPTVKRSTWPYFFPPALSVDNKFQYIECRFVYSDDIWLNNYRCKSPFFFCSLTDSASIIICICYLDCGLDMSRWFDNHGYVIRFNISNSWTIVWRIEANSFQPNINLRQCLEGIKLSTMHQYSNISTSFISRVQQSLNWHRLLSHYIHG